MDVLHELHLRNLLFQYFIRNPAMTEQQQPHPRQSEIDAFKTDALGKLAAYSLRFAEFVRTPGSPAIHNFDGDKRHVYMLTALATSNVIKSDAIAADEVIAVKYFYCHWIEMVARQGGEINEQIRTVVLDAELNAYGFVAGGVVSSIQQMVDNFGLEPFDPPIPVKKVIQRTRAGFNTTMLVPTF